MERGLRWLVAVCVGAAGFALVWYLGETWFGLDRSTAVTVATAAGSLVATPFIWWAGRERLPSRYWQRAGDDRVEVRDGAAFICYSHRHDGPYVERLAAYLAEAGVPVWFDRELISGNRWAKVVQGQIDACGAFLVVMTPDADESRWVEREIAHAERVGKTVLPLLLRGEPFFSQSDLQYEDVTHGGMPGPGFVARLRSVLAGVPADRLDQAGPGAAAERPGSRRLAALLVAAVLVVCVALPTVYAAIFGDWAGGDPPGGSPTGTQEANARPGAAKQSLNVNKTAWHAGFKFTFGSATYDRDRDPPLRMEAVAENLGPRNVRCDTGAVLSFGDRHVEGGVVDSPLVPARSPTHVVFEFTVDSLGGSLADGVLTMGDAKVNQTVLPLGPAGTVIAHEPRRVLGPTRIVHRDITYEFTVCEVRGDIAVDYEQAPAKSLAVACWIDATYTGPASFHYYDEDQFRLRLPDGTAVGPTAYPIMNLNRLEKAKDTYVAFVIPEPATGAYLLQLVDVHTGETETPATVKGVPLRL